ncbi:MAG TPA: hypothetical protein VGM18_13750 [Candidatus Sulfotelmatobacter sp.]|jgi:hypothetical protein
MASVRLHLDHGRFGRSILAWRQFWQSRQPACGDRDCPHAQKRWWRLRGQRRGVVVQGIRYCDDECVERAVAEALERLRSAAPRIQAAHRIPLGLLLLSRDQLTVEQLRAARQAQLTAGHGKIGQWLLAFGFVSESQLTAALARQWSCPVLQANILPTGFPQSNSSTHRVRPVSQIPLTLLEFFVMIPLDYVERTRTLHVAFGEGIDYSALYAIEQMLDCRTESCMASASFVRQTLQARSRHRKEYRASEVVMDSVADAGELSRIVCSYSVRLDASEIRLATCGSHLWVRFLCPSSPPVNLLLRSTSHASSAASSDRDWQA